MLVSVVIPLYNGKSFIERTLKSVLEQSYREFEIIVVNDGSTDGGELIAENFLKSNSAIHFEIIHSKNMGHAHAANLGASRARGVYLAFLDADDCFEKEKLEKMVKCIELNNEPVLIYSRFRFIDENDNLLQKQNENQHFNNLNFVAQLLENGNVIYGSNSGVLVRRECFINCGGYDSQLIACEDWDLWIRLAEFGGFNFVNENLALIRVHSKNQSGNKFLMLKYQLLVVFKHRETILKLGLSREKIATMLLKQMGKNLLRFYFSPYHRQDRYHFRQVVMVSAFNPSILIDLSRFLFQVALNKIFGQFFK